MFIPVSLILLIVAIVFFMLGWDGWGNAMILVNCFIPAIVLLVLVLPIKDKGNE